MGGRGLVSEVGPARPPSLATDWPLHRRRSSHCTRPLARRDLRGTEAVEEKKGGMGSHAHTHAVLGASQCDQHCRFMPALVNPWLLELF